MSTKFDQLYNATEAAKKALKKPFVLNKVNRALDGAADSYASRKLDKQERIDQLTEALANGDTSIVGELIDARLDLAEFDAQAAEAAKIKAELAAEVVETATASA